MNQGQVSFAGMGPTAHQSDRRGGWAAIAGRDPSRPHRQVPGGPNFMITEEKHAIRVQSFRDHGGGGSVAGRQVDYADIG